MAWSAIFNPALLIKNVPLNNEKILPGMIISNEPGFYEENKFGLK